MEMDKNQIKRIASIILIIIAIVLIFSMFFKSGSSAIVGKWQSEGDGYNSNVFEFYKNGTGLMYAVSGGDAWDSQTYSYIFDGEMVPLTWDVVRTYPCEVSGNTLLLDGEIFYRVGGSTFPWVRCIMAVLCLAGGVILRKRPTE